MERGVCMFYGNVICSNWSLSESLSVFSISVENEFGLWGGLY